MPGFPSQRHPQNGSLIATVSAKAPRFCNTCPGIYTGASSVKTILFPIKTAGLLSGIRKAKPEKSAIGPLREDFLQLILQHVLPKGFRRIRDFGFLHGNAKKLLQFVQLILHVRLDEGNHRPRPVFKCPCCKSAMVILGFRCTPWNPGYNPHIGKSGSAYKTGGNSFMENFAFLKPVYRLMISCALKKSHVPATPSFPCS